MKRFFLCVCLLGLLMPAYGQELYELFESYNTVSNKTRNKALLSTEVWMSANGAKSILTKKEYFNSRGLPDSIVLFDDGATGCRYLFHYDEKDRVVRISGNEYAIRKRNEFIYMDDHRTIHSYISSGDSLTLFRTKHNIFKAGKPIRDFTLDGSSKDTIELIYYNESGKKQYAKYQSRDGFIRAYTFDWNEDDTRAVTFELDKGKRILNEICYYDTKGNLLKRMEADNVTLVAGFEYDKESKMITSTFSSYKNDYVYDEKGYLKTIRSENVIQSSIDKNLPELIQLYFKHQFR